MRRVVAKKDRAESPRSCPVFVAVVSIVAAAYGFADGSEPNFLYSASIYGPACMVWFVFDLYRSHRNRDRPPSVEG